jgi:hypothetical protein
VYNKGEYQKEVSKRNEVGSREDGKRKEEGRVQTEGSKDEHDGLGRKGGESKNRGRDSGNGNRRSKRHSEQKNEVMKHGGVGQTFQHFRKEFGRWDWTLWDVGLLSRKVKCKLSNQVC